MLCHAILPLTLLISVVVCSPQSSCPSGCICRPDHANLDIIGSTRLTCSDRPEALESLEKVPDGVDGTVTHLDLSANDLVVVKKSFNFFRFPYVRHLNLSRNRIKSIEMGALAQFRFLRTLDLSHNQLSLLDHGLFSEDADHLETPGRADENEKESTYNDADPWGEMTDEGSFDEDEEEEEDQDRDHWDSPRRSARLKTSLIELDLSRNELSSIDGVFDGLESLTKLNLNDNQLENITSITFRHLSSLRLLVLNSNNIRTISPDAFLGAGKLTNLMMKNNPNLQHLDRLDMRGCSFLNYLDFSECGLLSIPRGLPESLRYLQLRRNHLTKVTADSFQECTGLNILLLDGNQISTIEGDAFQRMFNLQQLWLNENQLNQVPKHLPRSLQRLLLDGNQLTEWPSGLFEPSEESPPSLSTLSLSGNQIEHIDGSTFKELSKLSSLDLSDNRIQSLPRDCFSADNRFLESLNLNKNPLRQLHVESLQRIPALKHLFLSFIDTPLDSLTVSRGFLKPLRVNLKTIEMDHSPSLARALILGNPTLADPDGDDFSVSDLAHLEEISCTGLDLTTISKDDLNSFLPPRLKVLQFASSRWHCDRSLVWLKEWLSGGSPVLLTASSNLCYTPRSLHGKALVSLNANDLVAITTTVLPSSRPTKPSVLATKSTQSVSKTRSSSTSRHTLKTSKKLHSSTVSSSGEQKKAGRTVGLGLGLASDELSSPPRNNEDSLIIHVSDFIERTKIDDDDEDEKIAKATEDGRVEKETDAPLLENPSPDYELPNPDLQTGSFEKYFRQYFPENDDALDNSKRPHDDNYTYGQGDTDVGATGFTGERNNFIVTVAIVIIVITAIVAAFIIFLIVLTCRKKKKPFKETGLACSSKDSLADSNKTIIKYKNKDGILYFSTSSMTGIDSESADMNGSGSTRQFAGDRKFTDAVNYRSSPTLSDSKSGAHPVKSSNNSSCSNYIHNNNTSFNNKTLSYRWEDTWWIVRVTADQGGPWIVNPRLIFRRKCLEGLKFETPCYLLTIASMFVRAAVIT